MKKDNLIYNKSFDFAVKVVKIAKQLINNKEYVLGKQLLRSGTSIGANVREAIEAQSKKDFIAKLSISLKEAGETEYWIKLLLATDILNDKLGDILLKDIQEIIRILNAILKTSRKNMIN